MDHIEAIEYIHSTLRFGSKLGLENIKILLKEMGDPQKSLKFIHVAGTNGKGSTTAFLSYALIENGLKVGTYTSPYLIRFNERIRIGFDEISNGDLASITTFVKEKVEILLKAGERHPTEFEIVTAIAFEYYKRKMCDIVVLEVGLGGRFDSTNVIDAPIYSVITNIGLDHKEQLGDTLEKIAFEKAGIIKNGSKVFVIDQEIEVMDVFKRVCEERRCDLITVKAEYEKISSDIENQTFTYKSNKIEISLLGEHQIKNSILAFEVLIDMGIDKNIIRSGFKKTKWPGRFEVIKKDPIVIIDGAHNLEAVIELKKTIKTYLPNKKIIFIFGVFKDKDYKSMVKEIWDAAKMFFLVKPDNERALDAHILAEEVKKYCKSVEISDKISNAVSSSLSIATKDDIIIAFGSLSYIGSVKEQINNLEE